MQEAVSRISKYLTSLGTLSESTVHNYKSVLLNFYYWFSVVANDEFSPENITILDIRDYVQYLANNRTMRSSSIRSKVVVIKHWVHRETGCRLGSVQVPADQERQPGPTYREMRDKLVSNVEKARSLRDVVLVRLLATTGLRLSRIVSLRVREIDMEKRRINNTTGAVPLTAKAAHVLQRYLAEGGFKPKDYLFPSPSGHRHISDRAARYIVSRYGDCSPEDLRRAMREDLTVRGVAAHVVDGLMDRHGKRQQSKVDIVDLQRICESVEV